MSSEPGHTPIRLHRLNAVTPRISYTLTPTADLTAIQEIAWLKMQSVNNHLHEGTILSVVRVDPQQGELVVQPERYSRLALQANALIGDLGLRQLGVKGLVTAIDEQGTPRTLIARRGRQTRIYSDLWEIAPAGGVDSRATTFEHLLATLAREANEELGADVSACLPSARPLAFIEDDHARSVDVVISLSWPVPVSQGWALPPGRPAVWEYTQAAWLSDDEVKHWLTHREEELTPPSRAILSMARLTQ